MPRNPIGRLLRRRFSREHYARHKTGAPAVRSALYRQPNIFDPHV